MRIYTVHEPPEAPADRQDRAERLRFVQDGFSWTAATLAPFWLILRGLWLALVLYVLAVLALLWLVKLTALGGAAATVLVLALHLLIGLEADAIERWTLSRNGWTELGSVSGRNRLDCERRFLTSWLPSQPVIRQETLARATSADLDARPLAASLSRPRRGGWRSAFPFSRG